MGQELTKEIHGDNLKYRLVAAVDVVVRSFQADFFGCPFYSHIADVKERADIILDFSSPEATEELVRAALDRRIPLVIATTGQNEEQLRIIREAAEQIPIFMSGNMSMGVALFADSVARLAGFFDYADVEIIETHRKGKSDVPSGTALMIANAILEARGGVGRIIVGRRSGGREKGDIYISSLRMGEVVGVHEVRINTGFQTFTFTHEAHSRMLFVKGAIRALGFISTKTKGLFGVKDFM